MRTCKKCGGTYSETFFQSHCNHTRIVTFKNNVCIGCQQTARDEKKYVNRPLVKARNTYFSHARKYIERGIIQDANDLRRLYGWDIPQMAHDIDHSFKNGCPYCRKKFADMEGGLHSVSLDIINPVSPPYYETNVRWVCLTCNKEKQRTPPDIWGARLQDWKHWRERKTSMELNPFFGLPMFDDLSGQSNKRTVVNV